MNPTDEKTVHTVTPANASANAEAALRAPTRADDAQPSSGALLCELRDVLATFGYDRRIGSAAQQLADARERLDQVAAVACVAAERVLGAVEESQAMQQALGQDATGLLDRLQVLRGGGEVDAPKLGADTRAFLARAVAVSASQSAILREIMLAQDFHDRTGKVIQQIGALTQELEQNLLGLLVDPANGNTVPEAAEPPVDQVQSQAEVDALLDSLGL
ncbi:MAG: protein phosphatase CheZ [Casimicrobiaceae bacterium]